MKALCLISGGIDSPVAAHLILKKGVDLDYLHLDVQPFGDGKPLEKSKKLVVQLNKIHKRKSKLYITNHGVILTEILKKSEHHKACVLCRRMMYRVAEKVSKKNKYDFLVTGENLAQVASQTLDNLFVESSILTIPIVRPLIAFNKQEIIDTAKEISTYEISIQPGQCCTATPKKPTTHATIKMIETEESKIDIQALLKKTKITICPFRLCRKHIKILKY